MQLRNGLGQITKEQLASLEKKTSYRISEDFYNLVKNEDGGYPIEGEGFDEILIYNPFEKKYIVNGIGAFLTISERDGECMLSDFNNPPEFFPKNLLSFADTGGGDLFCFDYSMGPNIKEPPIFYWYHEADIGKDAFFIAPDFKSFIGMFKPEGFYNREISSSCLM